MIVLIQLDLLLNIDRISNDKKGSDNNYSINHSINQLIHTGLLLKPNPIKSGAIIRPK